MYFLGFSLSLFALELALGCKKRWSSKVISIKADSSGGAGNPEFSVVAPGKDFCLGFQVVPKWSQNRIIEGLLKFGNAGQCCWTCRIFLYAFTFQLELAVVQKNNGHNEIQLCAVAPAKYDLYGLHLADITFTFSLSSSYCTLTNHTWQHECLISKVLCTLQFSWTEHSAQFYRWAVSVPSEEAKLFWNQA